MTTTNSATTINSKKPSTKQELIAANIKLLIEQLEAGQSDALTNYLTAMSRFHSYSFGNVLEIARQMPAATRVAGFWTWKNLGRSVKAGQKGIRILAPIVGVRRKKDEEANKDITKQNERILLGFRNAYVFDISQTDGVDLPEMREVSGDPGENIDRLAAFLHSKGIQLVYNEKIAPALGMSYGGRIALLPGESKAEDFDVLISCAFSYDAHSAEMNKLGRIRVLKARMNADLHMAEDLKNTGKGNLFVIFGEPEIEIEDAGSGKIKVKVLGVDVFHPSTGEVRSNGPDEIACWFIDTDYNEESFFVRHAYFLGANDPYKALKTSLKAEIDEDAWATLKSDTSRPFDKPEKGRIAVKVINHLGDEVMKVFRV
jgi:hypothetical protein